MNAYDQAYALSRALKESVEFREYKTVRQQVEQDPQAKQMLADLQAKRLEIQQAQIMGQEPSPEAIDKYQKLYSIATCNEKVNAYLSAEMRFFATVGRYSKDY